MRSVANCPARCHGWRSGATHGVIFLSLATPWSAGSARSRRTGLTPPPGENAPIASAIAARTMAIRRLFDIGRLNQASGKSELGGVGGERIGRHLIDARVTRSNGDAHILPGIQRDMFEFLLSALAWMCAIEIERKRVEKLQLLVVLEQVVVLDPARGLRILHQPSF